MSIVAPKPITQMTDRQGREYGEAVAPDDFVAMPAGFWPSSADAVSRQAVEWLLLQPACSAP